MRELNYMYLLTPHYMSAIIKESEPYSFAIKGYHSAEEAYRNLMYTNVNQILGYVVIYDTLPYDLDDLVNYINFLNEFGSKETILVLCILDPDGVDEYLLPNVDVSNITCYMLSDIEVLTDFYIKQNIFGTIVRDKFNPYKDKFVLQEISTSYNSNKPVTPVLPKDILQILSPISLLSVMDVTLEHDSIMREYKDNSLIGYMRFQRIKSFFSDDIDFDGMITRIKSTPNVDHVLFTTVAHVIKDKMLDKGGLIGVGLSESY